MAKVVLGGARAWSSWLLAVSFVVMVFALQTGYAITNPHVAKSLSLTLTQVGIIGSLYTWVFAISQFVSGALLDKFGTRVLPIACALVAIGAFTFANATNIYMVLLAQVITAIGASFGFIGAGFVGGTWFEPIKYGFMFSLVQFVASTSAVVNQRSLNFLIERSSWSTLINGIAVATSCIAVLLFFFVHDPAPVAEARRKNRVWKGIRAFFREIAKAFGQVAAIKDSWINALIGGATFGTMLGLGVVWGPRFLVEMGLTQGEANIATSMSWFGLAVGALAFAWLSDTMQSRKKPMLLACFLQLVVIIVLLSSNQLDYASSRVLFFLWGFMAGGSMIPFAVAADLVKPALIGTSAALVNGTQFVVAGIMMAMPGRILAGEGLIGGRLGQRVSASATQNLSDFKWALLNYPLALILALALFLFLAETYPKTGTGVVNTNAE